MNLILISGTILGFISVAFGAYAEHGLKARVDSETFRFLMTAIRYNQVYAILITAIGLTLYAPLPETLSAKLFWAGVLFSAGCVLFSVSIYLAAQLNIPNLTRITPIGGITLMIAWAYLGWIAVTQTMR